MSGRGRAGERKIEGGQERDGGWGRERGREDGE